MCADCTTTRPFLDPLWLNRPEVARQLQNLRNRIGAQAPLLPCDDPEAWDWRAFLERRKEASANLGDGWAGPEGPGK